MTFLDQKMSFIGVFRRQRWEDDFVCDKFEKVDATANLNDVDSKREEDPVEWPTGRSDLKRTAWRYWIRYEYCQTISYSL